MKRMAIPSSAVLLFTLVFASPVLAQPANDTYAGRVVIAGIPFATTLDTTEATTDSDDAALNTNCGAPATDASVWYEIVGTDQALLVDVSASDYSAGVIVATGSPGMFELVTCGPGAIGFFAEAGTTYAILVFDDQLDGIGTGGMLDLSVDLAPPAPEIDVTIDPTGSFIKGTGGATITGTVMCTDGVFGVLEAFGTQRVGRLLINGFGFAEVLCDGTEQAWEMELFNDGGLFKGGRLQVQLFASACTFECGFDEATATVKLRG